MGHLLSQMAGCCETNVLLGQCQVCVPLPSIDLRMKMLSPSLCLLFVVFTLFYHWSTTKFHVALSSIKNATVLVAAFACHSLSVAVIDRLEDE
ncbi:unnamed protein product [Cylicocyclus nassatus]|uniref:Uncharacterized protein n=1 Tax=Cylicocyclus nassatus TaxID=53992 RepID=A0AA36M493_CYLNA|nr:unnamed protein product [Cylicocyclus nassatus]